MKSEIKIIATRKLSYVNKGSDVRKNAIVCISEPYYLTDGMVDFSFAKGTAGCNISFDGLDEKEMSVYGVDKIQALAIAVDAMDKYLKRLSRKYDFYFEGDPYFED